MQVRFSIAALALTLSAAAGWVAHRPSVAVQASSATSDPRAFQMQGTGPSAQLTVYEPGEHRFYVYQGVGGGYSSVFCSYSLELTHSGGPLERRNCGVGTIH